MDERFVKNIVSMRGDAGKKWLDDIPNIIKEYEKTWGITVLAANPFMLTYNYVTPAQRRDGTEVVLKIGFPEDKDIRIEIETLNIFDGKGSVKLIEMDTENAVMLLEHIKPGNTLKSVTNDEKYISVFAGVVKILDRPIHDKAHFPTITDWGQGFNRVRKVYAGSTGPFPKDLFEKAEGIFREYSEGRNEQYLLHGDLHDENILFSERGWLAIDPKGIIGEKEYETAMFLNDPYSDIPEGGNRKQKVLRRIAQLASELNFEKEKILNLAFAQSMLSAIWILEDHKEVSQLAIQNAELLSVIKI